MSSGKICCNNILWTGKLLRSLIFALWEITVITRSLIFAQGRQWIFCVNINNTLSWEQWNLTLIDGQYCSVGIRQLQCSIVSNCEDTVTRWLVTNVGVNLFNYVLNKLPDHTIRKLGSSQPQSRSRQHTCVNMVQSHVWWNDNQITSVSLLCIFLEWSSKGHVGYILILSIRSHREWSDCYTLLTILYMILVSIKWHEQPCKQKYNYGI